MDTRRSGSSPVTGWRENPLCPFLFMTLVFFWGAAVFFGAIHAWLLSVLVVSVADKGPVATQWLAVSMKAICLMLAGHVADRKVQQDILNPWGPAVEKPLFSQKKSFQKDHSMASGGADAGPLKEEGGLRDGLKRR